MASQDEQVTWGPMLKGFGLGVAVVVVVWGICLALGLSFGVALVVGVVAGFALSAVMLRRAAAETAASGRART